MTDLLPTAETAEVIDGWAVLMRETVDAGLVSLSAVFPMADGNGTLQMIVTKSKVMVIPPGRGPMTVDEFLGREATPLPSTERGENQ